MYMVSKPRRTRKWRWVAVFLVAAFSMYYFVWSDSAEDTDASGGATQSAVASAADAPGTVTQAGVDGLSTDRPTRTDQMPPPSRLQPSGAVSDADKPGPAGQAAGASDPPQPRGASQASVSTPRARRTALPSASSSAEAGSQLARGMAMIREGRLVQGRRELSALLFAGDGRLSPLDAQTVRDTLTSINKQLVFSAEVIPGDPAAESYMVHSGDYLSRIAPKYQIPYQFIERINNTPATQLRAGKPIKVIKGPFHARISKSDFRMDLYLNGDDGQPLYICSYPVGLGEADSTPTGAFIVQSGRKVNNPDWRNPRTGKYYRKDDPGNPIGEYWLALKGNEPATEAYTGYGIHGTIDPQSIGRQASMGCIRLRDQDIKWVFDMLAGGHSTVEISW